MPDEQKLNWYENDLPEEEIYEFKDYDVTSTPNDFNTKTIIDFIESGLFKIPGFQRNYVWDIKRASKLIESVVIGLPIPQVYLYEETKNSYLVIDGQQRLLTLYFFFKKKFPRKEKRFELRQVFDEFGKFPDEYLDDQEFFSEFSLKLSPDNKLNNLNYGTLGELRSGYDYRTIRNIMIKQNFPAEDDSAMFEIFNRLNSGGIVLKPQEIRISLYHSKFYNELFMLNLHENYRILLNQQEPDIHMKDVEIILRGLAMLMNSNKYNAPMTTFLNSFSRKAKSFPTETNQYLRDLFKKFCDTTVTIGQHIFLTKGGKFSITVFESIFVAMCDSAFQKKSLTITIPSKESIERLKSNRDFINATQDNTAGKKNVETRLRLAKEFLV
jgi:uncharacterized protein with ParB-like and HNH nuclease domain